MLKRIYTSLYLGRTLHVCWEELKRPQLQKVQAIRLINTKKLFVLDLTPPNLNGDLLTREIYRYFMTWPLIAACSIKVRNESDNFKPEYIIPQLLLQWVRNNDKIDGIRYKSNNISSDEYFTEGELYNVVLPVKENNSEGICNHLRNLFETSEVVSWQLFEYSIGGKTFLSTKKHDKNLNNKLPYTGLIKGRKYPYSHSTLGQLELFLDGLETKKIEI